MIKFTHLESKKNVYVNTQNITYISVGPFGVELNFLEGKKILVLESEDEVVSRLYGQQLNPFTSTGNYEKL